jgi:hypothetical protein
MFPRNACIYLQVHTALQDQHRQLLSQVLSRLDSQRVTLTVILLISWSNSNVFGQLCHLIRGSNRDYFVCIQLITMTSTDIIY